MILLSIMDISDKYLDIAGRVTYTTKDLGEVFGYVESKVNISPYLIELRYPLSHYPNIGNIYKDVVIDQKRIGIFFRSKKLWRFSAT